MQLFRIFSAISAIFHSIFFVFTCQVIGGFRSEEGIKKKGSFEIKEANFAGIFNDDDIDTDEINSALKILLEAITDEKSIKVVNLSDNKIDDSMAYTLSDSFASIVSSKLVALTLDNNFMRE